MEEKTGKIQRRTQSSSARSLHDNDTSQSDHIPLDLTIQILSRLPAKSVGRFRSVSKLWSTITTSQDFINSFPTWSLAWRPSVLLAFYIGNILFVFSSRLNKISPFTCVGSYQHTKPNYGCYRRFDYLRGLILLQGTKQLVIWNPTVNRFLTLPEPEGTKDNNSNYLGGILGYDHIDGKYIVLRVLRDSKICILTLGAQGKTSCRLITNGVPRHRSIIRFGECINGVMYYGATVDVGDGLLEHNIMCLDVRTEKFNQIKFPEGRSSWNYHMVTYEGRLALVETFNFPSIDIWTLTNGDRHEWTHNRFVLPLSEMELIRRKKQNFCGVSNAGELVFAPWVLSESFYILYFDPRRNSIREVSFEGIVGDELRSCYGFSKDYMDTIKVYPNHIESLMSF
ncbi:F-box associated domain type 3 [Arabidopsis thaliana x Arabidopsis arenosa]|uniref:F-box associated domain type 3 n=1 Tax=Arabidopsis thaliana x Arabidopsis arenosa TaxID=1240361 RepID=A0A8T2BFH7_9BRAS|nr:F-box associated domain type 3 [Arabidopsis thaliana x Arabidopsis arenosa]